MEVHNTVQEAGTKTIPKEEKFCKMAKWYSEEAFQTAEERGGAKGKGERERYTQLNAKFQRIAKQDKKKKKKAFLNEQCREIEENRIRKTRDLFKKIGNIKGTFHASSVQSLSHVQLFATLWTVAHQTLLSVGFSRQEYLSGLPYLPLWDFPGKNICLGFSRQQYLSGLP